ncbi:MAG: gluconate 2-dehydrogenase subunit 3 family protein [Vicinamibacterales bacterium]
MDANLRTTGIDRRTALRRLTSGGVALAASATWVDTLAAFARQHAPQAHATVAAAAQTATGWKAKILNPHQLRTVGVLSELIIPKTDTPGAMEVHVDRFIDAVLAEATPAERDRFVTGLAWMDVRSRALYKQDLVTSAPAQQTELLTRLSAAGGQEAKPGVDFFTAIKTMTITGYYTTQIGLEQELGDDGVLAQGSFEGCTHPEHQQG